MWDLPKIVRLFFHTGPMAPILTFVDLWRSLFSFLIARCLFGPAGELFGPAGALFGSLGGRSENLVNVYNIRVPAFIQIRRLKLKF